MHPVELHNSAKGAIFFLTPTQKGGRHVVDHWSAYPVRKRRLRRRVLRPERLAALVATCPDGGDANEARTPDHHHPESPRPAV